jgi:hypothetical protein
LPHIGQCSIDDVGAKPPDLARDRDVNIALNEPRSVLGHAEIFEPIRNLLHRGDQWSHRGLAEGSITATESLSCHFHDSMSEMPAISAGLPINFQGSPREFSSIAFERARTIGLLRVSPTKIIFVPGPVFPNSRDVPVTPRRRPFSETSRWWSILS